MGLVATYFGANGWLLEFGAMRVLVDPWLRGSLSFPPGPWLLKGELPKDQAFPLDIDLILLTQGIADHAHPVTLKELPKDCSVVGSATAAQVALQLGFSHVTPLNPGQDITIGELRIQASAGAPVPKIENGYLIEHPEGCLYMEPHGFLDQNLKPQPLDAVITPIVDVGLPVLGPFLRGRTIVPELVKKFQPKTILASTTGGDIRFTGLLSGLMTLHGSMEEIARDLPANVCLVDSQVGGSYMLTS